MERVSMPALPRSRESSSLVSFLINSEVSGAVPRVTSSSLRINLTPLFAKAFSNRSKVFIISPSPRPQVSASFLTLIGSAFQKRIASICCSKGIMLNIIALISRSANSARLHRDIAKVILLFHIDNAAFDQLKHSEKANNHIYLLFLTAHKLLETHFKLRLDAFGETGNHLFQTDYLFHHHLRYHFWLREIFNQVFK